MIFRNTTDNDKQITVTLTESGFVPSEINILQGQTVTFVSNISSRNFWPASDAHPTHAILSSFDPNKPLKPNERWSYTFDEIGSWDFHDHLQSELNGTVTVYGALGESTTNCVEKNIDKNMQHFCWIEELKQKYETGGLDEVFSIVHAYLEGNEVFKSNCHDVMHFVGELAYKDYQKTGNYINGTDTAFCNYGFFHGYIETLFQETGSFDKIVQYCESLQLKNSDPELGTNQADACYHGVGHSLFDSLPGSVWGNTEKMAATGLNQCEEVFHKSHQQLLCATGISNALGIALGEGRYGLAFDESDIFAPCKLFPVAYQTDCYKELSTHYPPFKTYSREAYWKMLTTLDSTLLAPLVLTYTTDQVQWRIPYEQVELKLLTDWCFSTADQKNTKEYCVRGVHFGMRKVNTDDQAYADSKELCALYPASSAKNKICSEQLEFVYRTSRKDSN